MKPEKYNNSLKIFFQTFIALKIQSLLVDYNITQLPVMLTVQKLELLEVQVMKI